MRGFVDIYLQTYRCVSYLIGEMMRFLLQYVERDVRGKVLFVSQEKVAQILEGERENRDAAVQFRSERKLCKFIYRIKSPFITFFNETNI